jgi:hypothetical protein
MEPVNSVSHLLTNGTRSSVVLREPIYQSKDSGASLYISCYDFPMQNATHVEPGTCMRQSLIIYSFNFEIA